MDEELFSQVRFNVPKQNLEKVKERIAVMDSRLTAAVLALRDHRVLPGTDASKRAPR